MRVEFTWTTSGLILIKINISEINSGIKKIIYFERVLKSLDNLVILISLKFNFC